VARKVHVIDKNNHKPTLQTLFQPCQQANVFSYPALLKDWYLYQDLYFINGWHGANSRLPDRTAVSNEEKT
jgi:hypothetical protein